MSDDGSYGQKGVVTMPLEEKIKAGANFGEVITIGPLIAMKFVVKTTSLITLKTVVSMNPIAWWTAPACARLPGCGQAKPSLPVWMAPISTVLKSILMKPCTRGTMYRDFEARAEAGMQPAEKEVE